MESNETTPLDERQKILRMLEENKISAEQAISLLDAIGKTGSSTRRTPEMTDTSPDYSGRARWFRVKVTDTVTGRSKASVTIPIGLMEWGLKLGAQFTPEINGVNIQELSQVLQAGEHGKLIDVIDEEDGEHVEIFVE